MKTPRPADVSEREAEVLAALGAALSNAQIAHRLHISVRTVEGHVSSLLRKYGVVDRRALAALAGTARTLAPPGHVAGLPSARTTFVGRARERDDLLAALGRGGLVTLVGPGGVGKTRLAAVVAEAAAPSFPFGGAFVDLVPVRDGFVAQAVAAALDVTERAQQPLEAAIVERLGRGRCLLVLDNCEHVVDAAAGFAERVLAACPETIVLATSRERLGIAGERLVEVAPLPLLSDAERLFHDRAAAADPGSALDADAVADLCARLDGLPLAIELAAARCASLGAPGLLTGLGDYLRLLAGGRGSVVRHRSLRAVIDWSHDLLSEEEQALFRRLGAFAGGFDLDAVAAVAGDGDLARAADLLGRLVDKSLVIHRRGPASSWRLLETIRAFAVEKLDGSAEPAEIHGRHLRWAAGAAAELDARRTDGWRSGFDVVADDLRAALAAAPAGPDATAHRLARSLGRLTFARRFLMESLDHYVLAARHAPEPAEAARDLGAAAEVAQVLNDSGRAFELHVAAAGLAVADARASALARAVEMACRYPVTFHAEIPHDRLRGMLDDAGTSDDPVVAAQLAIADAWAAGVEKLSPDPALADAAAERAEASGDPVLICAALDAVRTAAVAAGDAKRAHRVTGQRLGVLRWMDRGDPRAVSEIDDMLGLACSDAVAAGDVRAARAAAQLILDDELHGDHPYLTASKVIPAFVLAGEIDEAIRMADAMWAGWERAGRPPAFWMQATVHFVALAHGLRGDRHALATWRAHAAEVAGVPNPFQARLSPLAAFVDARVAVHTGEVSEAAAIVDRAQSNLPHVRYRAYARAAAAELAVVAGLPDAKGILDAAMPVAAENDWAAACLDRTTGRLLGDPGALRASAERWEHLGASLERAATLQLLSEVGASAP